MRKEEKLTVIEDLTELLSNSKHFYLTDSSTLDAVATHELRKACFEKQIKLVVVKNTLLKLALDKLEGDYEDFYPVLKGATSLMLCETGNAPARLRELGKRKIKRGVVGRCCYIVTISNATSCFCSSIRWKYLIRTG